MNTLSEVQQKMRSAVKAKLLELKVSLITEELPDYIMVMIANKRSKSQMIDDLGLFLGAQTDTFVQWLCEVLKKLNQVTLSTNTKNKSLEEPAQSGKKDKKEKKKDKKEREKKKSESSSGTANKGITDVFAEDLIEKAKKTLQFESKSKAAVKKEEKRKAKTPDPPSPASKSTSKSKDDGFDIPTISEIAENAVEQHIHKRELAQLQELQKQIDLAKKQLKSMITESDDEDLLNLGDDDDIDMETIEKLKNKIALKQEQRKLVEQQQKKPSALSRLGIRANENSKPDNVINLSAHRKSEREFYVAPNIRKLEKEKPVSLRDRIGRRRNSSDDEKDKIREKNRTRQRSSRERVRSRSPVKREREQRDRARSPVKREREREKRRERSNERVSIHQRIGSRVIVMPPKPVYSEEEVDVPVNSIIQIKPRAQIPPNKQASKNLLLKAVAEAQKSTAAAPKNKWNYSGDEKRERSSEHKSKAITQMIVRNFNARDEEEYVPEPISTQSESDGEVYRYRDVNDDVLDLNNFDEDFEETSNKSPQFVVTLEGAYNKNPNLAKIDAENADNEMEDSEEDDDKSKSPTPPPVVPRRRSIKDRIGSRSQMTTTTSTASTTATKSSENKRSRSPDQQQQESIPKRNKVQPIRFDLTDDERRSSSRELESDKRKSVENGRKSNGEKRRSSEHEDDEEHSKKIKKLQSTRSFDHVPSLSSVIVSTAVTAAKMLVKSKERCKYFPACRLGDSCEFHHPTTPCKLFPNCKFGDKCAYLHPRCKFDTSCLRSDCNFMHTPIIPASASNSIMPPLASSIVPAATYKSITSSPLAPLCKYYPHCQNMQCTFFHPKICRFGKNCLNKLECNFYHYDIV